MPLPRPTKRTARVMKRVCDAIALGAPYEAAAKYGGISYETFRLWKKEDEVFADAVDEAEGRNMVGLLAKIERAINKGTWQAAAWKLERRYPQHFGRRLHEVTGRDGAPVQIELTRRQQAEHLARELDLDPDEIIEVAQGIVVGDAEPDEN